MQGTIGGVKLNEPVMEDDYWEPADDVNELYQQLSANKYRDIKSSQIQYVTLYFLVTHISLKLNQQ